MIKPSNKSCNKEVQKFTNTSYDILLKLYNNTAFFKELYEQLSPTLYTDFTVGLGGWKATVGTLTYINETTINTGGDFYIDGLDIDANKNKIISLIFAENTPSVFVGDLEITYTDDLVVLYENIFELGVGVTAANIDLSQYDTHTNKITKIRFILSTDINSQYTLYTAFIGKPLVPVKDLTALEAQFIALDLELENTNLIINNQESRIDDLEERPVINIDPDTLTGSVEKYIVENVSFNGLAKNITMLNDTLTLQNTDNTSYLSYLNVLGLFKFKGILELPDGTLIEDIDDIKSLNGNYTEFRFKRSINQPSIDVTDPEPTGWDLNIPVGSDSLWMTSAIKLNNALVSNWTVPTILANNLINAELTANTYTAISEADGSNPNLNAAGGEFILTENNVKVTSGVVFSGGVTKNGLIMTINASTGVFSLSQSNWSTDVEFFDLTATYKNQIYKKRYSVVKQKGVAGGNGLSVITIMLYKASTREATTLAGPKGPVTFNLSTLTFTEDVVDALNGWTPVIPDSTLPKRWVVQATITTTSTTVQIQTSKWSEAKVLSIDGIDGTDAGGGGSGLDGFSRATVYAYKAANSILSTDNPGDCTYDFSTGSIVLNNGWETSIPESVLPIWVRTGLAISRTSTDVINSNEWADAVKITGSSLNSAQLFIYKRTDSNAPPTDKPTVSVSYDFTTGILSGVNNGWSTVPPLTTEKYLWIRSAMASSTNITDNIETTEWNEARLLASNGSDGSSTSSGVFAGAERKGASYPNFNWNSTGVDSATARWGTLAGRSPVNGDVFIQVNITTGATEARAYNGSAWVLPEAVYESLVAFGTISGDQILAGSVINAPIIRGGSLELIGNTNSTHISITRNDPFGPNNLIEWFGPKITNVTWNTNLNAPLYNGMTKANAVSFKGADGSWYTSGSIIAGTLRNSVQSTTLAASTNVETGTFGSNGGILTIKCSFSASKGSGLTAGSCPVNSDPTGTMYLDKWVSSAWVEVASHSMLGSYTCFEEGPEYIASWNLGGAFTYTDSEQSTQNRQFRLRVVHNTPVLPNGSQRLSIITEE